MNNAGDNEQKKLHTHTHTRNEDERSMSTSSHLEYGALLFVEDCDVRFLFGLCICISIGVDIACITLSDLRSPYDFLFCCVVPISYDYLLINHVLAFVGQERWNGTKSERESGLY